MVLCLLDVDVDVGGETIRQSTENVLLNSLTVSLRGSCLTGSACLQRAKRV